MKRRGFALIAALWFVVAISGVLAGAALAAHQRHLASANIAEEIRATAAARSGIADEQGSLQIDLNKYASQSANSYSRLSGDPWINVGRDQAKVSEIGGVRVAVTTRDVGMLFNINRANYDDLRRFFSALRIDAGRADGIAQCVLDWRDSDDLARAHGAEKADYVRRGALLLPRNSAFLSFDELRSVLGVTEADYNLMRPFLTLIGSGRVNINDAQTPVLMSLPGISEEIAQEITDAQRSGRHLSSVNDLINLVPSSRRDALARAVPEMRDRVTFVTQEAEVRSFATMEGSPVGVEMLALIIRGNTSALLVTLRNAQ
jgi:general secretion pathway protein K